MKGTTLIQDYRNDSGIGFMYPRNDAVLCGICKVYGLAYAGEGWLEDERGIERVIVSLGGSKELPARLYVKNRYWIRTFDSTDLPDGPLEITVAAYDRQGVLIGTVSDRFTIDNSHTALGRRLYAANNGEPCNDGSISSPFDLKTGLNRVAAGDVLFIRGGVYSDNIILSNCGEETKPITILNYNGEKVELKGAGIDVADGLEYVNLMGIDQSGLRFGDSGLEMGDGVRHLQFWDCSFNDNTHPYEEIPINERLAFGTGFQALTVRGWEDGKKTTTCREGLNRQFITVSHCETKYNGCHGFDFSSIDHGRFQFLESAWNPNHKKKDIFQYKHADGFTMKNSEYEGWGFPSEDSIFLFCYSHHNGQDGFDIRPPHVYLFGCTSHDETQSGAPFGGSGIKTWEYDYKFFNCLSFRNNITDRTGYAMEVGNNSFINNCLFYNTYERAVQRPDDDPRVTRIFSHNNIFVDSHEGFAIPVTSYNSLYFGTGKVSTLIGAQYADPQFIDAQAGNFYVLESSPALTGGDMKGFSFLVDGVDYCRFDALGRPRASMNEIGPYTRYPK